MNRSTRTATLIAALGTALSACAGGPSYRPQATAPVTAAPVSPSYSWYAAPATPSAQATSPDTHTAARNYMAGLAATVPAPASVPSQTAAPMMQAPRGMTAGQAAVSMWRPCRSILC
jgi:hypothetical protein